MTDIYVLDSCDEILLTVKFKSDHLVLLCKRGWIKSNTWLIKDKEISTISIIHFEEYLKEAA